MNFWSEILVCVDETAGANYELMVQNTYLYTAQTSTARRM